MTFLILLLNFIHCNADNPAPQIAVRNDPNFSIVANENPDLKSFNRKVVVFGIPIYAVAKVDDKKLLHAANVMAQYLDNDENGIVDNSSVVNSMLQANAFMVMWKSERDLNGVNPPDNAIGQDLGNDETITDFVSSDLNGRFDATLEEVLHIITHAGYALAYPEIFGEFQGTSLTNAMDKARGGKFLEVPSAYPENAWYSYDDITCEYDCMATEYIYWALTSLLGAQKNRLEEIQHEWKLNTPELVQTKDAAIYSLLTDPDYSFPTVLPDGSYRH